MDEEATDPTLKSGTDRIEDLLLGDWPVPEILERRWPLGMLLNEAGDCDWTACAMAELPPGERFVFLAGLPFMNWLEMSSSLSLTTKSQLFR